ncbi:MerR family transcriptional regulator [Streptomyces litchfieldiae]|uniref:MerR family transcriptional regulator n=1 Tax=Streptomyces litchfieldiae TaxID=3075543 RepID=A0ABU2N1X5_9ACTN|nr:MerR family transcriptional regulator [Streptomyces sp. DSM 44938]MDT0347518.1 MerR family transcriptional regulator [Streptomyces sp. DSM 44938]
MDSRLLPIGSVARHFGLPVSTLHYWERVGLLRPARRVAGRRFYGPEEMRRIALVTLWQRTGMMSLEEIGAVLEGRRGRAGWQETVGTRIEEIDAQLRRLTAARAYLSHMLECPRDNPARDCPKLHAEIDEHLPRTAPAVPEED